MCQQSQEALKVYSQTDIIEVCDIGSFNEFYKFNSQDFDFV